MAEENHQTTNKLDSFIGNDVDDMSVLNTLLRTVKGISPVSASRYELGLTRSLDDEDFGLV